jgi:hypothetical protein
MLLFGSGARTAGSNSNSNCSTGAESRSFRIRPLLLKLQLPRYCSHSTTLCLRNFYRAFPQHGEFFLQVLHCLCLKVLVAIQILRNGLISLLRSDRHEYPFIILSTHRAEHIMKLSRRYTFKMKKLDTLWLSVLALFNFKGDSIRVKVFRQTFFVWFNVKIPS